MTSNDELLILFKPLIPISNYFATRLTVGYNFAQQKTMINEVVTDRAPGNEIVTGKITIKPRGVNVRLATTYSF